MEMKEFARFLKDVGDGAPHLVYKAIGENSILLPPYMCCPSGQDATIESINAGHKTGALQHLGSELLDILLNSP